METAGGWWWWESCDWSVTTQVFVCQHQRFITEARDGEPEVLWVGDNLMQNLSSSRIWDSRLVELRVRPSPQLIPAASAWCTQRVLAYLETGQRTSSGGCRMESWRTSLLKSSCCPWDRRTMGTVRTTLRRGLKPFVALLEASSLKHSSFCWWVDIRRALQCCSLLYLRLLQTLLPRGGPNSPLRIRNERVNQLMADYVKGNSRVQLVNIDTGFVQVPTTFTNLPVRCNAWPLQTCRLTGPFLTTTCSTTSLSHRKAIAKLSSLSTSCWRPSSRRWRASSAGPRRRGRRSRLWSTRRIFSRSVEYDTMTATKVQLQSVEYPVHWHLIQNLHVKSLCLTIIPRCFAFAFHRLVSFQKDKPPPSLLPVILPSKSIICISLLLLELE